MSAIEGWCWAFAEMAQQMSLNAAFSDRARRRYARWSTVWNFAGAVASKGVYEAILHRAYVAYQIRQEERAAAV